MEHPSFPTLAWWWTPREENPELRLPQVPATYLTGIAASGPHRWAVGESSVILHSPDNGLTWERQTDIDWGSYPLDSLDATRSQPPTSDKVSGQSIPSKSIPTPQPPLPPEARGPVELRRVVFADERRGWIVGEKGLVLNTEDAGAHWTAQPTESSDDLTAIALINSNRLFAVGENGIILETQDGGKSWSQSRIPQAQERNSDQLIHIFAAPDQRLWIAGAGSLIYSRRPDQDQSWIFHQVPEMGENETRIDLANLICIWVDNANRVWAVGENGIVWHSPDGGKTWRKQAVPTIANLLHVTGTPSGELWITSAEGAILHSTDAGESWKSIPISPHQPVGLVTINSQHLCAVSYSGAIIETLNGGLSWKTLAHPHAFEQKEALFGNHRIGLTLHDHEVNLFSSSGSLWKSLDDGKNWTYTEVKHPENQTNPEKLKLYLGNFNEVWATTEEKKLFHSSDFGKSWSLCKWPNTLSGNLKIVCIPGQPGQGIANDLSQKGPLETKDGGQSWEAFNTGSQPTSEKRAYFENFLWIDNQVGWIYGDGVVSVTSNGGKTWKSSPLPLTTTFGRRELAAADSKRACIVAKTDGNYWWTKDAGEIWQESKFSGNKPHINALSLGPNGRGWAIGNGGLILRTTDAGATWIEQTSDTTSNLAFLASADGDTAVAISDIGEVLRTNNGGATWRQIRQYRRSPAPFFYLSLIIGLGFIGLTWRRIKIPNSSEAEGIIGHGTSDKPIGEGDTDALNLKPLVEGIASFLHHEQTSGPLALAVCGAWGSGKSSLMNLLRSHLEAKGFRPAWFNAWHHHDESQILAALLEHIRSQTVPPLLSAPGLAFRARLLHLRLRRNLPTIVIITCGLIVAGLLVNTFGAEAYNWIGQDWLSRSLGGGSALAIALTLIYGLAKSWQGLRAFDVDPAKLLASVANQARLKDLGGQTSFRHRFAEEFADVTAALQPRTMTIFIDDLDRCEPEQVMQVMRALNFLASSGQCFLILGMDEQMVTNCIALALKDQFEFADGSRATDEAARLATRLANARLWMEKLVQIHIPVPTPNDAAMRRLLMLKEPSTETPKVSPTVPPNVSLKSWLNKTWPILSAKARRVLRPIKTITPYAAGIIVPAIVVLLAQNYLQDLADERKKTSSLEQLKAETRAEAETDTFLAQHTLQSVELLSSNPPTDKSKNESSQLSPKDALKRHLLHGNEPLHYHFVPSYQSAIKQSSPTETQPNTVDQNPSTHKNPLHAASKKSSSSNERPVGPGQSDATSRWWFLVLILPGSAFVLVLWVRNRLVKPPQDSPKFGKGLLDWSQIIAKVCPTPRGVKRLINKLRFHAMLCKTIQQQGSINIDDRLLIVNGVMESASPEQKKQITDYLEKNKNDPNFSNHIQDLKNLENSRRKQSELYRYISGSARFDNNNQTTSRS